MKNEQITGMATTKDWLAVSRDMVLSAHSPLVERESLGSNVPVSAGDFASGDFESVFGKLVRRLSDEEGVRT